MTHQEICALFEGASDFETRTLRTGEAVLYAYFIDGLVSSSFIADYIYKPITLDLPENVASAYQTALRGGIYNAVARPCKDLQDAAVKIVNGFCVVLFPGSGAIAFEVRTGVSRGPQPPDVENTVKGPKDAFVETVRSNTSLVRRHLRTPDLRLYETTVGRRSLTNVTVVSSPFTSPCSSTEPVLHISRTEMNVATISERLRLPLNRLISFSTPRSKSLRRISPVFLLTGYRSLPTMPLKFTVGGGSCRWARSAIRSNARSRSLGSWR